MPKITTKQFDNQENNDLFLSPVMFIQMTLYINK